MSYTQPTKTVGDVFEYVKRQFGDESGVQVVQGDILRWVAAAEAEIISSNEVLRAVASTNTVVGQDTYTLGDSMDIGNVNSIMVRNRKLEFKNFNDAQAFITANDPDKTQRALPMFWYEWGGNLFLYPLPDAVYTLQVFYHKAPNPLLDLTTVLNVPDNYFNRVCEYAMSQAYELDEQFESANYKSQQFAQGLLNMSFDEQRGALDTYPMVTILPEDW